MNFTKFIIGFLAVLLIAGNLSAVVLVKDGKPTAVILLGPEATDCAKKGASELQEYVKAMSGAELPIQTVYKGQYPKYVKKWKNVILIGSSTPATESGVTNENLKPDGFRILVKGNIVAVVGSDSKFYDQIASRTPVQAGTLYGVYRLLEIMGIRFYQQDNTLIPKSKTIELKNMKLTENPYFPYRINELMVDPWFRRIGYGGDRDPWASHHSFHYWYKRFADTHPEYFCLDENGKSDLYYPAFTHDGVIEQMIADAKSHFSRKSTPDGKRRYFQILANDYFMRMCSCPKCQAWVDKSRHKSGWYSDYIAQAVVKVANAVKEEYPDCYIVYGAYERYQLPPKKIKKLPDNVVVQIASLRRATRPHWLSAADRELLEQWQELQPAGIYFWRYYTYGRKGVPWVMPHIIADSIKAMKEFNEKGKTPVLGEMHFFRRDPTSRWWQNVNDYVSAKMLWNPDLDCNDILDEYYTKFYGPASGEIKGFFELLENNYMTYSDSSYIPNKVVFELNEKLTKGLELTKSTVYAKRIQYIKDNFVALEKCVEIYTVENKGITAAVPANELVWKMAPKGDKSVINHNAVPVKNGFRFNGKNSYLRLKKPVITGNEYSLEAWICPGDLQVRPVIYGESFNTFEPYYIFGSRMNDPTYNNVGLAVVGKCLMFNDINNGTVKSKPLELQKGQWYHVAAVMDKKNSMMVIYLDGKLVGIETIIKTIINRKPSKVQPGIWLIGAGGDNASKMVLKGCRGFFDGMIKEVRIYNKPLSPAQVLERSKGDKND